MSKIIKQADFIESVRDALQFISFYHPTDFIQAMGRAYDKEESKPAKDAMAQILINSRMAALGHRPMCQDTGIICAFIKIGMDAKFDKTNLTISEMVDEGVRQAYLDKDNPLRASIVRDPLGSRKNTKDNTPSVVHIDLVHGDKIDIQLAAKGGGSEFKSKFTVLNPSDDIVPWVLEKLPEMGAGWCPPGILGIGVGGTAEKAMILAKEAINQPIDIQDLILKGPSNKTEEIRLELYEKVNNLGIGAQGLGGLTTVLDVKINTFPTHAVCLPVAMIPNCASTRHIHFVLDGSGPAVLIPPSIDLWPEVSWSTEGAKHLNVNSMTQAELNNLKAGETVLLSGTILTGRDAAHKRIQDMVLKGEKLPVDFHGKIIYYVGPVNAVRDEVVGPAGPTTATRMDKFSDLMFSDAVGIRGMIGKSERGPVGIESIKKNKGVYFMAVGGAAYLISKSIKSSQCVAFEDLGMEAVYQFDIQDMPVTVAVDTTGDSVHESGPQHWKEKILQANIGGIPVRVQS